MKVKKTIIIILFTFLLFFILDNIINAVMMRGINNYYGLSQDSEILLIGHSHLMLATDKKKMEQELGMKVSKYCREGVNVSDKKVMVEHFLNNGHSDSLKFVLYGVDLATFTGEGLSKNSYKLFYPFMDDEYVDSYISEETDKEDYWLHKLIKSTRFNDDGLKNSALRGWFNNWDNFKNNVIDIDGYKLQLANGDERNISMNPQIMTLFKQTIKMITDKGIKVILVNTPTVDLLNQYEHDKYEEIIEWFSNFAENNKMVEFIDYNPKYSSDYSIFSDRLHLNLKGQQIISTELINYIKYLENENPDRGF